jgi:hypothetical protein
MQSPVCLHVDRMGLTYLINDRRGQSGELVVILIMLTQI